jgi:hypothetical protein
MKKIFSLFAAVLFAGSMMATTVTFTKADFEGQGTANTGSEVTATKDGVTFTYSKGYCAEESLRCYAHGALSITAESTIQKINFTTTGGKTGGLDAEVTVNATSYTVDDLASQARFTEIVVTLGEGGEGGEGGGGEGGGGEGDEIIDPWAFVKTEYTLYEDNSLDVALFTSEGWSIDEGGEFSVDEAGACVIFNIYPAELPELAGTYSAENSLIDIEYCGVYIWDGVSENFDDFEIADATVVITKKSGKYELTYTIVDGEGTTYKGTVSNLPLYSDEGGEGGEGGESDAIIFTREDFLGQGTANTGSEVSATKGGVTFTYSKGYCADESLRCYAHGALSITADVTIEKIQFTTTGGKTGGLDAEVTVGATSYTVDDLASQARFTEVKVYLAGGGTAVENTVDEVKAVKILQNGQLFIEKNGVRYNVQGAVVK